MIHNIQESRHLLPNIFTYFCTNNNTYLYNMSFNITYYISHSFEKYCLPPTEKTKNKNEIIDPLLLHAVVLTSFRSKRRHALPII